MNDTLCFRCRQPWQPNNQCCINAGKMATNNDLGPASVGPFLGGIFDFFFGWLKKKSHYNEETENESCRSSD